MYLVVGLPEKEKWQEKETKKTNPM